MRLNTTLLICWRIAARLLFGTALVTCAIGGAGGCTSYGQNASPSSLSGSSPTNAVTASASHLLRDPLRVADRVHIEFHGTPETIPYSEQEISEDGSITLQYIGHVQAAGKTPGELEKEIEAKYENGYYTHIGITVTPTGRFFYVGGQVNPSSTGGRVMYAGPITVTQAIYAAGDFTDFANKKKVQLTRVDGKIITVNCVDALQHPEKDPPVFPGDRIYVPRRFW